MAVPGSWRGMVNEFNRLPADIREYFEHFTSLTQGYPWDVVIAYLHSRTEVAHNMTLYCGVVKCHKVNAELARKAIENMHITRDGFKTLFYAVYGEAIHKDISKKIETSEEIRDKILHGKPVTEPDKRKAVYNLIIYAKEYNEALDNMAGIRPFGSLRGFKGRTKPLGKETSRWILKGIGLSLS